MSEKLQDFMKLLGQGHRLANAAKRAGSPTPTVGSTSQKTIKGASYNAGLMVRGYVKQIYYPTTKTSTTEEYSPNDSPVAHLGDVVSGILCDVMITESPQTLGLLQAVPILTTAWGIAERFQWVPRAVEHNIAGGDLNEQTLPHDTEADCVVVAFLDNDMKKPVIIGSLPHPRTPHHATIADGTHYKMRALVRGNEFQVEDQGKVVIDIRGQTRGYRYNESDGQYTASGNPTFEIKSNASTVRVDDTATTIVAGDSVITVGADGNVNITTGAAGKVSVTGNTAGTVTGVQPVLLDTARIDIAKVLAEYMPTIAVAGALFGTAIPGISFIDSPSTVVGLAGGVSGAVTTGTTGKNYAASTLETD